MVHCLSDFTERNPQILLGFVILRSSLPKKAQIISSVFQSPFLVLETNSYHSGNKG